jgi:hypothetical protein
MGSKNVQWCTQNTDIGFGFDFLELYHKHGNECLKHTVQLAADET